MTFFLQNLLFRAKFCANYSISLEKSPLSNILPAHDIRYEDGDNVSRLVHDPPVTPTTPSPKIWGRDPNPPGLTPMRERQREREGREKGEGRRETEGTPVDVQNRNVFIC